MAATDPMRNRWFQRRDLAIGLASLAQRIGGLAAGFLLGVVLARALGPAQFGVYGLVVALGALAMTIGLLGTPQLAVREFGARHASAEAAALSALSRSTLLAVALASSGLSAFAILVGGLIDRTALDVIVPGALAVPFIAVTALAAAQLRGLGEMNRGQVMDIVARPALALLAIAALIAIGMQVDHVVALWVQALAAMTTAVISLAWLNKRMPRPDKAATVAPWLHAALPLCMVDLLRQFDGTYGSILLGWAASDTELGLYRAAISCSVVAALPVTILHIIHAPRIAKLLHDGDRADLQILLGRVAMTATILVGAITAGCLLLGRPLINLVFGAAYDGSWAPLAMLCVAQLAFALFGMGPILLAMGKREKALTRIYLLAIATAVAAAALLVRPFGATGVAAGQLVSLALVGGLSWREGRRQLHVDCSVLARLRTHLS